MPEPRYTIEREWERLTIEEKDALPIAGFKPTRLSPSGLAYHQWNVLDGEALFEEGIHYRLRAAGATRIGVKVDLSGPAPSGAVLAFTTSGTAGSDQFTIIDTSPITVPAGSTEVTIHIDPKEDGRWYTEKDLVLTLDRANSTGLRVDDDPYLVGNYEIPTGNSEFRLYWRPNAEPPSVEWASASQSGAAGASHTVNVNLSAASLEATKVYYEIGGTLGAGSYTITSGDESGALTIPAGSTSATLNFDIAGGAVSGQTLTFELEHPPGDVDYTTSPFTYHTDENLWTYSGDWSWDIGPFAEGREWPGSPTNTVNGGIDPSGSTTGWSWLQQVEQTAVTDPDGEAPLGIVISQHLLSNETTAYVRESFEDQTKSGGPYTMVPVRKYVQLVIRRAAFGGAEAGRTTRFFQIVMIIREVPKIAHQLVIDTESTGFDVNDDPTIEWTMGTETWSLWDSKNLLGKTTFGATRQRFDGEGRVVSSGGTEVNTLWMNHEIDPSIDYKASGGVTGNESEGDRMNILVRPAYISPLEHGEVGTPLANKGQGSVPYWIWWTMSDTGPYVGAPQVFWHRRGRWFEPRGNASQLAAGVNTHTFTVA